MKHIATVVVLATAFGLGIAPKAQAWEDKECSNATLKGSFGYSSTGTLLDSFVPPPFAGPFAEVGRQTFDGKGKTDGTATVSSNGNINQAVAINGTYEVKSDCTGSMTLNIPAFGATVHVDFVIDRDGEEIRAIVTDAGVIESRVYKKQFLEGRKEKYRIRRMGGLLEAGAVARQLLRSLPALALVNSAVLSNCDRRPRFSPRRSPLAISIAGASRSHHLTAGVVHH